MNPVIEAFRGLAALMVLVHHYSYRIDGIILDGQGHFFHNGVDLFFVITGFLFAPCLLGEVKQSLIAFIIRRTFRLYPLYFLSLIVAVTYFFEEKTGLFKVIVKHLLFIQALPINTLSEVGILSLVYWTLPVEVMFYAIIVIVMAIDRHNNVSLNWRSRLIYSGVITWIFFTISYYVNYDPSSESWVLWQAQLPALLPAFWLGLVIHCSRDFVSNHKNIRYTSFLIGIVLLFLLFAIYPNFARSSITARPFGWFNIASAIAYALLLSGILGLYDQAIFHKKNISFIDRVLVRVAQTFGSLSYGIYLFHEWALVIVEHSLKTLSTGFQILLSIAMTIIVTQILNKLVELPFRNYGRKLADSFPDKV
jgi:peptidoglycan/LPS O-acetylase OafA/YrhL